MNSASVEAHTEHTPSLSEEANEKLRENISLVLIRALPHFFCGFVLSTPLFSASFSPLCIAFISASDYKNSVGIFLGGCIGFFLYHPIDEAIRYVSCAALVLIIKMLFHKKGKDKPSLFSRCIISFGCSFLCGALSCLIKSSPLFAWLSIFGEGLFSGIFTYFYSSALDFPTVKRGFQSMNARDTVCFCLSICSFIISSAYITVEGISPARIFFCLVLMFTSLYKGSSLSSVIGIITGVCLSLFSSENNLFPAFSLGALISGLLSSRGQITVGLTFTLPYLLCLLFGADTGEMWPLYIEPCISLIIFIVIPGEKISQLQERADTFIFFKESHVSHSVAQRLDSACKKMDEAAEIINTVSEKLDNIINPEVNRLFSALQQNICDKCDRKQDCWKNSFASTAGDILHITGIERKNNDTVLLSARCRHFNELTEAAHELYPTYTKALAAKNKNSSLRRILSDELTVLGNYISDLSQELARDRYKDKAKSAYLKTALKDAGIHTDALCCFACKDRLRIEIYFYEMPAESVFKKIRPVIEFVTGRRFEEGKSVRQELRFLITFDEKPIFNVSSGFSRHSVKPGFLCGDSVSIFSGENKCVTAVISDGMGTGTTAAVNSNLTVSLTEKLLSCGFSMESTVKTVNSALIIKSTDETLSTLDIVTIDMFSARATFYKAGAAISFIRHKDEITVIEKESLPLGILREVCAAVEEKQLTKGDIILLVSDGVTSGDCGWINDELLAWSTSNMNDLAGHIASLARLRNQDGIRDDITVAAMKIGVNK